MRINTPFYSRRNHFAVFAVVLALAACSERPIQVGGDPDGGGLGDGGAPTDSAVPLQEVGPSVDAENPSSSIPLLQIEQICAPPDPPSFVTTACDDLSEVGVAELSHFAEDGATTTISTISDGLYGASAVRVQTEAAFSFEVRWRRPTGVDIGEADLLQLAVRATNDSPVGWQGNFPLLRVTDGSGATLSLQPTSNLLPRSGGWVLIEAPLDGSTTWTATGNVNRSAITGIDIVMDTWDNGFVFDLDGLAFRTADAHCAVDCDCGDNGTCDPQTFDCVCDAGFVGSDCSQPLIPEAPSDHDVWPNPESNANSDPWLARNHHNIRQLRPRLLVVNLANPSTPEHTTGLVDDIIAGLREGSRPQGWRYETAPQLEYELVKIVDLRDGVDGRPPAPADYPYENSTLTPRRPEAEEGYWRLDYAEFFGDEFANHYGFEDPEQPGRNMPLCELVERGLVHELWFVGSGDVPDVNAAEALEYKQRWRADGTPIEGDFERCAGNGCFDADVPRCDRSIRIGFVNYNRGPGCYLHSQGHALEWSANSGAVPTLLEWWKSFAGFDLDTRYGLPVRDLYGLSCGADQCIERLSESSVRVQHNGEAHVVDEFDPRCGNVHFPPNAVKHYDYDNTASMASSCADFGRHGAGCGEDITSLVDASTWAQYEELSPDCGGAFLVWWYQNMPAHGSQQYFSDRRRMPSVWPYLFY